MIQQQTSLVQSRQSSRPQWTCTGAAEATGGTAGMGLCEQGTRCQQTQQLRPKSGSGCRSHRRARSPQWSARWSCWQVHVSAHLQPLFRPRQQGRRSHKAAQSSRAPSTCRHLRAWASAWTRSANRAHSSALLILSPHHKRPLRPSSGGDLLLCAADLLSSILLGDPGTPRPHGELEPILIAI